MAKNSELQCTRMKLLTQPATLETKRHRFSLIKSLSIYENEDFLIKKPVQRKIIGNLRLSTNCFVFVFFINQTELMIFWPFASVAGCV